MRFKLRGSGGWLFALALLGAAGASAFPNYGTSVDSTCTANGWVPARPYASSGSDCGLCHTSASNPGSSLTPAGDQYRRSGHADVTPFCSAPAANRAPSFAPIAAQTATVGSPFALTVTATDPDGDALLLSAGNAPSGSSFVDDGNGTGRFSWTPTAAQLGAHAVTFHVTDTGTPMAVASLEVSIAVGQAVNRPPVLDPIGNQQLDPGQTLDFTLSATDPEGQSLAFSATGLPAGAALLGADFAWTPDATQIGQHTIVFTVTDTGSPAASDSETVVFTVGRINRPPVLSAIGNRQVQVGSELRVGLTATDPDADPIALDCTDLPVDAVFTDFDDGTAEIVWMPSAAARSSVTCTATDTGAPPEQDAETFTLSAVDATNAALPTLETASWRIARGGGRLAVRGTLPTTEAGPRGGRPTLDVFAVLGDGMPVLLGSRAGQRNGSFRFELDPFIAPCAVAVASGGVMSEVVDVIGAPSDCDTDLRTFARARNACDGSTLVVAGARGPIGGRVVVSDAIDGAMLGVFDVSDRNGRFGGRLNDVGVPAEVGLRAEVGGLSWSLATPLPVSRDRRCSRVDEDDDDRAAATGDDEDDDESDDDASEGLDRARVEARTTGGSTEARSRPRRRERD
ncbi:MAG: Ig-like domain-containing protein [Myxococcota bacterium]